MKYYEWTTLLNNEDIDENEEYIIVEQLCMDGIEEWELAECKYIPYWNLNNNADYLHSGKKLDVLVHTGGEKIISRRLGNYFSERHGDQVQVFPIKLKRKNNQNETLNNYYLLHPLGLIDCIDFEATPHTVDEDDSDEISLSDWNSGIVLDYRRIGDYRLFRLKRLSVVTILREDVLEEILKMDMTGIGYNEVQISGA